MPEKIDWYDEFVDLNYNPAKDDLICLYYFEPAKRNQRKRSHRKNRLRKFCRHMDNASRTACKGG